MHTIPIQRYAGNVSAFAVYGLPSLGSLRMSKRTGIFLLVGAILAALWAAGAIETSGLFLAGPVALLDNEKVKQMRQRRGQIVTEQRALLDANPDGLSAEDDERYDKLTKEDERLAKAIDLEERDARLSEPNPADEPPTRPEPRSEPSGEPEQRTGPTATPEYRKAFRRFLATGDSRGLMTVEQRATANGLQADADAAGGFTVAPLQFVAQLIKFVDNQVFIRQFANVQRVESAAGLGAPSLDADPEDGDWTQELTTVDFDSQMEFGKRELRPHELTKGIKVSRKLLRLSTLGIEDLVIGRLGYKIGVTQETAFMTGNGVNRPLGIFTASNDGIPTSRDTTAASQTTFTGDELLDVLYSVKAQYQANGRWILHRDAVKVARKLKDGNGQYLWQPGLQAGQPDSLVGRPYIQSEYAPNTFTTGLYVAAYGDLSQYWIADAEDLSVQRLVELYAATNQIGFIARSATDGMPVLAEAFARLKLGA